MKKVLFQGCGTAIATPFDEDGVNFKEFEKLVDEEIINPDETNIAFVDIEEMPKYHFLLIENTKKSKIKKNIFYGG